MPFVADSFTVTCRLLPIHLPLCSRVVSSFVAASFALRCRFVCCCVATSFAVCSFTAAAFAVRCRFVCRLFAVGLLLRTIFFVVRYRFVGRSLVFDAASLYKRPRNEAKRAVLGTTDGSTSLNVPGRHYISYSWHARNLLLGLKVPLDLVNTTLPYK